ncbi:MAG: hypothetical protein PVI83_06185 [Lysobacterales bacterium]|jgi:hypothetical protein
MRKTLTLLFCILFAHSLFAAEGFSSLEEQMTGKEFMASGLTKLSPEELDALNAWIRNRSLATLDKPGPSASVAAAASTETGDLRGLPSDDERDDSPIRSAIIGEFDGWDGQTVFRLENGMIWVQDDRDKFYARDIKNAVAVIEPGMFDSWHLHIEGYKAECKVRRIQ